MALIAELEDAPRGAYCGAIGYLAPGPAPSAHFNVAIRTVVIDEADGAAVYGAGGGITWASTPAGEYEELLVKAAVLPTGTREPFALLETPALGPQVAAMRRDCAAPRGASGADAGLGGALRDPGSARGARSCCAGGRTRGRG